MRTVATPDRSDAHYPVHALLVVLRHLHPRLQLRRRAPQAEVGRDVLDDLQHAALQGQAHLRPLRRLEVVVHVRGEHHQVALHEEARRLEAHDQVLARHRLGGGLPHLRVRGHARAVARQVVRFSGMVTTTVAVPSLRVTTEGLQ